MLIFSMPRKQGARKKMAKKAIKVSTLVSHRILFTQRGENASTPQDPTDLYVPGMVDLTEKISCCISYDNDMLVQIEKYSVRDVSLPVWLDPKEWLRNTTTWRWVWGFCEDLEWPENWQRGIQKLSSSQKLACVKLLRTKTFKSEFRANICTQLKTWFNTPETERKYENPFSLKQWDCLIDGHIALEAKQIDSRLYYDKRNLGCLVSERILKP
jgi:hypothetical protein